MKVRFATTQRHCNSPPQKVSIKYKCMEKSPYGGIGDGGVGRLFISIR